MALYPKLILDALEKVRYPGNGKNLVTQAGVGLACYKTTTQKAEAAAVFAKWLTESDRNLAFVAETGYMPIKKDAFDKIKAYEFKDEGYESKISVFFN